MRSARGAVLPAEFPQTPASPGGQRGPRGPRLYGGLSWISLVEKPVGSSVRAVDEAVLGRLRQAIAAEDGNEGEQLSRVLRMLGADISDENQIPLFDTAPGSQAPDAPAPPLVEA